MADKIEIDIEGEDRLLLALERVEERNRRELRDILDDIADETENTLISMVPMYSHYILEHIRREGPEWRPGGAGGGGEWKAIVGIRQGSSRHPVYVEFGTGIYAGRRPITARSDRAPASVINTGHRRLSRRRGGVLTFQKHGEPRRFRYWVSGQRGQHYFYQTWRIASALARLRVFREGIL